LGEFAVAEHIRDILMQEQDHQIALANALGLEVPNVTKPGKALDEHSRINAGMTRQTTLKAATTDANTERNMRLASH
jgi:hypothetical protein